MTQAFRDAFEVINTALNKLTEASTPDELLAAVSDYARRQGASGGQFFSINANGQRNLEWAEVAASWSVDSVHRIAVGTRLQTLAVHLAKHTLTFPIRPILIADTANDEYVDEVSRELLDRSGVRALVQLPLYRKQRWLGAIVFAWTEPYPFDERDLLIYTALLQQVIPVTDSIRLLEQSQLRTRELARVNSEIHTLYNAAQQLNQAMTPDEQLEAVSTYAREQGATQGLIFYIEQPDQLLTPWAVVAAEWTQNEKHRIGVGVRFAILQSTFIQKLLTTPARPTLAENLHAHSDVDAGFRALMVTYCMQAAVVLPIRSGGRWIGLIWFTWDETHQFTPDDRRIYSALLHQAAGVLDSLRLLNQARQRTLELEIINAEIDMLYHASEAINSATTYREVLEAVAPLDPDADTVAMMIWENFDYHSARYIEPVALIKRSGAVAMNLHDRLPKEDYPICERMLDERVWHFADFQTDMRVDKVSVENFAKLNVRALLGRSLYISKRWIGGITFSSASPRSYSQRQVRVFAAIGDLVLAAIERIRLQNEKEVSRRRAELLALVNGALSRATDERSIMAALALYVHWLDGPSMTLTYIDTDELTGERVVRATATWEEGRVRISDTQRPARDQYCNDEMVDLWTQSPHEPLFFEDIGQDERISPAGRKEYVRSVKARAVILLPLVTGGHQYGSLRISWSQPRVFTEDERYVFSALLQSLPSVVASRRNYLAERQRARELAAVARLSAAAASILDEQELLRVITALTNEQFSAYDIVIYLLDEHHQQLVRVSTTSEDERVAVDDSRYLIAKAARTRQSAIVNDIHRASMYCFAPVSRKVRSIMALPLVASERLVGVLEIQSQMINRFTQYDTGVMGTLADLIAVAIQNARLYQRAQAYAALQERHRLARELHDSVSQALYGIALGARTARRLLDQNPAQLAEPLDYVLNLSEAGLTEMRALIFELRPETLEKEGLIEALSRQVTMLQARYNIQAQMQVCSEPHLSLAVKEGIYWIAREALHNVVKHARASRVELHVEHTESALNLCVIDDGIGFNPDADFSQHLGLKSMSERSQQIGGLLVISSEPGTGSKIRLSVPLHTPQPTGLT